MLKRSIVSLTVEIRTRITPNTGTFYAVRITASTTNTLKRLRSRFYNKNSIAQFQTVKVQLATLK